MKSALRKTMLGTLVAACALMQSPAHASILGTDQQRAKEELAIRLFKTDQVQQEMKKVEALYLQSDIGQTPSGKATASRPAEALAMSAALYAANEDADHPVIVWESNAAHKWYGLDVPRSGYGLDDPDNVYRMAPLSGTARYEIHGRIHAPAPAQQVFVVYTDIPGVSNTINAKGHMVEIGGLYSDKMDIAPDGTFTITIDSDPANGRKNHIQSDPSNQHLHLVVRDTLSDWTKQNPIELNIQRVGGSSAVHPAKDEKALAARAAEILSAMGPFWLNWTKNVIHTRPVNEVPLPWSRETGWGYTQYGHFNIADDEAWVVTLDPMGAGYVNFQLADPWGIAVEYIKRIGSLTQKQAHANKDGTYTFVVTGHDPGVYNWLDTGGLQQGTYQIRWQAMPPGVTSAEKAVRSVRIVKLKDLKSVLPPETGSVTATERKEQLASRSASYARRLEK